MDIKQQADLKIETLDALYSSIKAYVDGEFVQDELRYQINDIIDPIFNNLRKSYVELKKNY